MSAIAQAPRGSRLGPAPMELLISLIERQLRLLAKRSWFGLVWPFTGPLFLLALYVFVFGRVFKVPIDHYGVFLFAGLLPWSLAAQSIGSAVNSLSFEPELIRRTRFPYELLPIARLGAMGVYFLVSLTIFTIYLAFAGFLVVRLLPLLVVPVAALFLLLAGLTVMVALIDVYNRDLRAIIGNLLTVWFFMAPIVYRPQMLPPSARVLLTINPMSQIVGEFRDILFWGRVPALSQMALMLGLCAGLCALCLVGFRKLSVNLPKDV